MKMWNIHLGIKYICHSCLSIKTCGLIPLFILFYFHSLAQKPSSCYNSDFSTGDFSNWIGHTSVYPPTPGTNINIPYYYNAGIVNGRHTIISTATPDPYTCNTVLTLPQGEKFAARLGNGGIGPWGDGVKWQRDYLEYTFAVTSTNSLLSYKYAVVLQDPNSDPGVAPHTPALRPRFLIKIKNTTTGALIDPTCGYFEVVVANTLLGFRKCTATEITAAGGQLANPGSVLYRGWTTVGVDLRAFVGQNVTVQFETWDCGLGGHFGYAYISARCDTFAITAQVCNAKGTVRLTAPAGFSYNWVQSNETTQSIEVRNAKPGDVVKVILTTTNGCSSDLSTTVYPNVTKAAFSMKTNNCLKDSVVFKDASSSYNTQGNTGIPIVTWLWDFGDGNTANIQNPGHTYANTGHYDVKLVVFNQNGCSDTIVHGLDVLRLPIADFSTTEACKGNVVPFNDLSAAPDGTLTNWKWRFSDGDSSLVQNPAHVFKTLGAKTVTLTVRTDAGCRDSLSKIIKVLSPPQAQFAVADVCLGFPSIFIDKSSPGDPLDSIKIWVWNLGDNSPSVSSKMPVHQYFKTGTYKANLSITSKKGCTNTVGFPVNVFPPPQSVFKNSDACPGVNTNFTNLSVVGNQTISYQWNFGDNTALSNQVSPSHIYSKPGSFNVSLLVKTSLGCNDSSTKIINVNPSPDADFNANKYAACSPLCTNFSDLSFSSSDSIKKWAWDFGDATTSSFKNPSHCYKNPGTYSVSLITTTALGCQGVHSWMNMMTVYPAPTANFSINPAGVITAPTALSFYNLSTAAKKWEWNFGDNSPLSEAQIPVHTYGDTGTYKVWLTVYNDHGCKDSISENVIVAPLFKFFIPNAFRPNGNGKNDIFYGYGIGIKDYKMSIFDRWGEKIFESNEMKHGWDGTVQNQKVQEDVYVYVVELKDVFKKMHRYSGIVTLLK